MRFRAMLLAVFMAQASLAADSDRFKAAPEPVVIASPAAGVELGFSSDETVVDFDVSPVSPTVALLVRRGAETRVLLWSLNGEAEPRSFEVSSGLSLSAVAWHPEEKALFLIAKESDGWSIRRQDYPFANFSPRVLYRSSSPLRRLIVSPRLFSPLGAYPGKQNEYRLYFGLVRSPGRNEVHTIRESGEMHYVLMGNDPATPDLKGAPGEYEAPRQFTVRSALPMSFHPSGVAMLWQDENACFKRAGYGMHNWEIFDQVPMKAANPCGGSLTHTPNGLGFFHWQAKKPGVRLLLDGGKTVIPLVNDQTFLGTPSPSADGRGLVGLVRIPGADGTVLRYVPTAMPLADVVNAWTFAEQGEDRTLFSKHGGLFRSLKDEQIFQLFDSERYDTVRRGSLPQRPFLVTTDLFWELYAASFESLFSLVEKKNARPTFWRLVDLAATHFSRQPSQSAVARLFQTLAMLKAGNGKHPEVGRILAGEGMAMSQVTGRSFDYSELIPRGHYDKDEDSALYFRAVRFLSSLKLDGKESAVVAALPAPVQAAAREWIDAYSGFIAPSRHALAWSLPGVRQAGYVRYPDTGLTLFPLSWGLDNEVLNDVVYHRDWPLEDQIGGAAGVRLQPSGLDLAHVLGSDLARDLLAEELRRYPRLGRQLEKLRVVAKQWKNAPELNANLYHRWLAALGQEWRAARAFPGNTDPLLWNTKRLQSGLASWATLRHATILVNDIGGAEGGEGGESFEYMIQRPPRGYVEPAPETFAAIASLFDTAVATLDRVSRSWSGVADKGLRDGLRQRLRDARDDVNRARLIAEKEVRGEIPSDEDYAFIDAAGSIVEHSFLVFKSATAEGMAIPDPMSKAADVFKTQGSRLIAAVGKPLEWDQIVPFHGRRQIVKGPVYSYFEFAHASLLADANWREMEERRARPAWVRRFLSPYPLPNVPSLP